MDCETRTTIRCRHHTKPDFDSRGRILFNRGFLIKHVRMEFGAQVRATAQEYLDNRTRRKCARVQLLCFSQIRICANSERENNRPGEGSNDSKASGLYTTASFNNSRLCSSIDLSLKYIQAGSPPAFYLPSHLPALSCAPNPQSRKARPIYSPFEQTETETHSHHRACHPKSSQTQNPYKTQ
ncbi:hypothetical protein BCR34DRAFT_333296 [Clohesyomyces aquaticus]|uniref:Uncharacterized protein n=1 Tax=Clohesyomyces aquaticus TaxID=1231657 RepID=A0A1Y1ZM75_9PLEO|nr:hypothetical protein BCR34DRAFT_333296 [Clohesyomyces aquaticus]